MSIISKIVVPTVVSKVIIPTVPEQQTATEDILIDNIVVNDAVEPNDIPLRRSTRERRSAISDDYLVYLQESEIDSAIDDPISYKKAIECEESDK